MSLCPRGCGRPSRRVLWVRAKCPALCLECHRGAAWDGRGRYLKPEARAEATRRGNATRRRREAVAIEAAYQAALVAQRLARKVAA